MYRTWHRCLVALLSVIFIAGSAFADIDETILQSSDDAGDVGLTPTYDEDNVLYYLYTAIVNNNATAGWRFQSVDIPQGATITSATLTFATWAVCGATGGCVSICYGVDADDIDTWSSGNRPKDATKTSASSTLSTTSGDIADGISVARSFNVITQLQEIVDRVGWVSGNNMGFITKGSSGHRNNSLYAYTYDNVGGAPVAELAATYTTGGATPVFGQVIIISS